MLVTDILQQDAEGIEILEAEDRSLTAASKTSVL